MSCFYIPMPVSITDIFIQLVYFYNLTLTYPWNVNLRAFPIRLVNIYSNLIGSVNIIYGICLSISYKSSTFLIEALKLKDLNNFSISFLISVG